ncbi:2-amino-4-hydroxy-6-hydroxymethyldihydropteridine diphosphokinase [Acetoanaerobium noterae]|uniref:2-amino-4-hydroxy-6- hydroxymethyldihydropteridine diphosphokinase n=1 Tax=Acetoanaerobium noterae TaxID=745369 RepID=UPI0028A8EAC5|nr:2-amino-4-hydroxy-6-hydroxymethyldihydropteridine diphosphokinase [Acetoanaerobium noterae]
MVKAFLSLGSNMGDRLEYLSKAIDKIAQIQGCNILNKSRVYETEPWGYENQEAFLNLCISIETSLSPYELLESLQTIELELDRVRKIHWGPRTIDIDILLFDDIICEDDKLTIPHPRMSERAFVLIPLYDIEKNLIIDGIKLEDLINKIDTRGIKEYKKNDF